MTAATHRDNKTLAMLAICGGVALASCQDAILKWMSGEYPVHQAVMIRSLVAAPIVLFLATRGQGPLVLFNAHTRRALVRGLVLASAYLSFVLAIAAMPIADAVAIYFTMPFIVAALAWPILGEYVRAHRWLAIGAGFLGVIIMLDPGSGVFEPAALFALYAAFGYALGQMMGRELARHLTPQAMAFHQNLVYLAVAALLALGTGAFDFSFVTHKSLQFLTRPWAMPSLVDFLFLCSLGVIASFGMILFGTAYKLAESSFVAPFEYTAMFWAVVLGFALFGDLPGPATILGGAVVIGAGIFMLVKDARASRMAGPPVPAAESRAAE